MLILELLEHLLLDWLHIKNGWLLPWRAGISQMGNEVSSLVFRIDEWKWTKVLTWHAHWVLREGLELLSLIVIHESRIHYALSSYIKITEEHTLIVISELAPNCVSIPIAWWRWVDSCWRYHSMHILFAHIAVATALSLWLHDYHRLLLLIPWFLAGSWILRRLLLLILRNADQNELFGDVIFLDLIDQLMYSRFNIFIREKCWYLEVFYAYSIQDCLISFLLH